MPETARPSPIGPLKSPLPKAWDTGAPARAAMSPDTKPVPLPGSLQGPGRPPPTGPHQLVVLLGQQQDAAHVGLVVVERVELRGSHVEGPGLGEAIVKLLVEGQQVHVVHGDVVRAVAALQEAHVDERCPVKPVQGSGLAQDSAKALWDSLAPTLSPKEPVPPPCTVLTWQLGAVTSTHYAASC